MVERLSADFCCIVFDVVVILLRGSPKARRKTSGSDGGGAAVVLMWDELARTAASGEATRPLKFAGYVLIPRDVEGPVGIDVLREPSLLNRRISRDGVTVSE